MDIQADNCCPFCARHSNLHGVVILGHLLTWASGGEHVCNRTQYLDVWQPDRESVARIFEDYYPMTLAMIAGSMIAGSTPLGGGVVAFPVAVLAIGFTPAEGRDFTVLIQSVGMNAAAYLIIMDKGELLDFTLITIFILFGIPGVLIGLAFPVVPFYFMSIFQTLVLTFAFVFFYLNVLAPRASPSAVPTDTHRVATPRRDHLKPLNAYTAYGSMCTAAFAGGFLTANVGSGSDIVLYVYGLLGWNLLMPESLYFSDTALTACSVVVMGMLSLVTAICRALSGQIQINVLYCWGATAWLVCFGAPIGSLLLTPGMKAQLRIAFYVLAVAQFSGFAVLKVRDNAVAWIICGTVLFCTCSLLTLHVRWTRQKMQAQQIPLQCVTFSVVRQRLLIS